MAVAFSSYIVISPLCSRNSSFFFFFFFCVSCSTLRPKSVEHAEVARCTFLYHYLPPLFYALLSTANLIDLIPKVGAQKIVSGFFFVMLFVTYLIWSPWIYASPLTPSAHRWRQLFGDNWA